MCADWAHFVCIYLEYMDGAVVTAAAFKSCCATCFQNFISIPMKFVCGGVKSIYKEFKTNTRYRFCTVAFNILNQYELQREWISDSFASWVQVQSLFNIHGISRKKRSTDSVLKRFFLYFFFLSYPNAKRRKRKKMWNENERTINKSSPVNVHDFEMWDS